MIDEMIGIDELKRRKLKKSTLTWFVFLGLSFFVMLSQIPFRAIPVEFSLNFIGLLFNAFGLVISLVRSFGGLIDLCSSTQNSFKVGFSQASLITGGERGNLSTKEGKI